MTESQPIQPANAAEIHKQSIVIDAHSDVLMAIADGKMRLGQDVKLPDPRTWSPALDPVSGESTEAFTFSPHTTVFQSSGFYDIPKALEGGLTALAMAIYIEGHQLGHALHRALEMVYWLHQEAADNAAFSVVTTTDEIRAVKATGTTCGFLTLEGLEALGHDIKMLDIFARLGLRMAALTHARRNEFAEGESQLGDPVTGGLTRLGQLAVRGMNDLGIVVDLTHLNLRGCWEILELTDAPVVMTHERSFSMVPGPSRHSADRDLPERRKLWEAIARTGGVIGAIAYSHKTLADFVDFIEHLIAAVGPDHVGIGTDFYGLDNAPVGFTGIHQLPAVTAEMVVRGHASNTITKVLGGNFLRVFDQVWT